MREFFFFHLSSEPGEAVVAEGQSSGDLVLKLIVLKVSQEMLWFKMKWEQNSDQTFNFLLNEKYKWYHMIEMENTNSNNWLLHDIIIS